MNNFIKGVCSAGLGALAGAGLVAMSFVAIEALMPVSPAMAEEDNTTMEVLHVGIRIRTCGAWDGKPRACHFTLVDTDCKTGLVTPRREDGTGDVWSYKGKPDNTMCNAARSIYD